MSDWATRGTVGCFYFGFYAASLAAAEYLLISRRIPVGATTREDWIIVAGILAPVAALGWVLAFMLAGRILITVTDLIRRLVPRRK